VRDDAARIEAYEARIAELAALVAAQAETIQSLREMNGRIEARVAELERQAGQNSENSGKPPSRDPAAERQRQADEREKRKQAGRAGTARRKGKQRGAKGSALEMSVTPDTVVDHQPSRGEDCGIELGDDTSTGYAAHQVVDLPRSRRWSPSTGPTPVAVAADARARPPSPTTCGPR